MKILFRAYFYPKQFQKKVGRKFIMARIRIRIRTFSKVGSGTGQKSSGSTTLEITSLVLNEICKDFKPKVLYLLYLNKTFTRKQKKEVDCDCNFFTYLTKYVFFLAILSPLLSEI
jgi:hypothetical protein